MSLPISNIPIPAILEIRENVIEDLEKILKKHQFNRVGVLFDSFTFEQFKNKIASSCTSVKLATYEMKADLDIHALTDFAFDLERYDAIVAIGGGAIIDYGKYIAHSRRVPFISMPTSASNDGFASSNCSLIINGKKTTVPAKIPYGIIADLSIIKNAPTSMLLAGVGDLMSNITALYDWDFEEKHGVGTVNHFAAMLSKKAVNSFIRTPMDDLTRPIFLKELVSSLTMGGIATVISGNSAPISGSEHLISHALDKHAKNPQMHGLQVGIATYIMANVQTHRAERMTKVFDRTGFFDYAKNCAFKRKDMEHAIYIAPSIKPNRFTYLHDSNYQEQAISFVQKDTVLREILD